jgi:hypothetical protein
VRSGVTALSRVTKLDVHPKSHARGINSTHSTLIASKERIHCIIDRKRHCNGSLPRTLRLGLSWLKTRLQFLPSVLCRSLQRVECDTRTKLSYCAMTSSYQPFRSAPSTTTTTIPRQRQPLRVRLHTACVLRAAIAINSVFHTALVVNHGDENHRADRGMTI